MDFDLSGLNNPAVRHMLVAALLGGLVGVEREHTHGKDKVHFGGVRTYPLIAMVGSVGAWISWNYNTFVPLAVVGAGVIALLVASYALVAPREVGAGTTSEFAGLAVFLVGVLCGLEHEEIGVVLGVCTAILLGFKDLLHTGVQKLGPQDIGAGLKLLFATFIVLPFLPDHTIDPWDSLNPASLWLLVILISGLSLLGYVAVRWLGAARGTTLTGALAGLVSSTALTLAFVKRSKAETGLRDALGSAILVSWTVMFARVLVEIAVVNRSMLGAVSVPVGAGILAGVIMGLRLHFRQPDGGEAGDVGLSNPFSLTAAVKFGLFYAVVLLLVGIVGRYLPPGWLIAVAALAGTTDVDAITLSMARYAREGGDVNLASGAVVVAMMSNTLVKTGMVVALGEPGLRRRVLAGAGVICAACTLGAVFWNLL